MAIPKSIGAIEFSSVGVGYRIEDGMLILGTIEIGNRCFIGIHSALGLNTRMGDDSRLDDLSLLADGKVMAPGQSRVAGAGRPRGRVRARLVGRTARPRHSHSVRRTNREAGRSPTERSPRP